MMGKLASGTAVFVLTFCFLQVHFIFISLISAYDEDDFSEPADSFDAPSVSSMFKNTENTCSGPDCLENIPEFPVCSENEFLDEKLMICLNKVNLKVCDEEGCGDKNDLEIESEVGSEVESIVKSEIDPEVESEKEPKIEPEIIQQSEPEITSKSTQKTVTEAESEFWPEIDVKTVPESDTVPETEPNNEIEIDADGEAEILPELTSETVQTTEKHSETVATKKLPFEVPFEEESLTTEEIQRLAAAFVFCIIGTLASRGNLIWTAVLYAYLFAMFYWWAYDKHDDIIDSFVKIKTVNDERNAEKQRQRSGGYYYKTEPPAQPHN